MQGSSRTVDIIPDDAGAADLPGTSQPQPVDGGLGDDGPLHVIAGSHGSNKPSTPRQDLRATRRLFKALGKSGWAWRPAAIFPPGREWVQSAAAVRGVPLDDVLDLARAYGQEAMHSWFEGLLVATPTGLGPDLLAPVAVRARTRPAEFGCPMRFGDADNVCVREGGFYTASSRTAALVWEHHRAMLVAALGCSICDGGNVASEGRPYGITEMFTPSRRGGWAWGRRVDDLVDPSQGAGRHRPPGADDSEEIRR